MWCMGVLCRYGVWVSNRSRVSGGVCGAWGYCVGMGYGLVIGVG